jgi:eukaryotic-like serine/threonine-protein kinase
MGMAKREPIIVLIIVALLVSSCFISVKCSASTVLDYGWPMFGYNVSRTGFSEDMGSSPDARNWEIRSDSGTDSPAVAYGCVYYKMGHVVCYNAFTGETVWEAEREAAGDIWSVAVANGYVYADSNGYVYALNASTGEEVWTYAFGNDEEFYAPTVASGKVYVGCGDNNLYAFDAYDGTQLWNYTTGGKVRSSPAVVDNIVYVACTDGNLYAIDDSTGNKIWNYTTGRKVPHLVSSPAIANGIVYVGTNNSTIIALDALTGSKMWVYAIGAVFSTPAISSGYVYVTSQNDLYAFNASTGTKLWNFTHIPSYSLEFSSPTVADGVVYFGSSGEDSYSGRFYAINAYTGEEIEQIEMDSMIFSTPAVAYGSVYVASAHKLYAMGTSRFTSKLTVLLAPELLIISVVIFVIFLVVLGIYRNNRRRKVS